MSDQNRPGFEPPAFHVAPPAAIDESPTSKSSKSGRNRNTILMASAVGIAAVGFAGTAFAANAASTPTPTPTGSSSIVGDQGPGHGPDGDNDGPGMGMGPNGGPGQAPMGGPDGGPGGGWGRHGGGMRGPGMGPGIHGTFVTPNKAGTGYDTIDTQKGSVTAVSATSITVKSTDGFTKTYVVTSTTDVNGKAGDIATVKTGDDVAVLGIESGSDVNAQQIFDGKNFKPGANGKPDHNWQPGQDDNQPPAPNGSPGAGGGSAPASPSTSG